MQAKRSRSWQYCSAIFFMLCVFTFSPWNLAPGRISPFLLGLPYTLWVSILLAFAFLILTIVAASIRSRNSEPEDPDETENRS